MTEEVPLGGSLPTVKVSQDWKSRLIDWAFAQGAVAVVLMAWLIWTIYDGDQRERSKVIAAQTRMEWESKLWNKVDVRLTELSDSYTKALEKVIQANERKTERDEIRFDKIVDRIKGN